METSLNVLIVEHSPDGRDLILMTLRQAGYDPVWQRVNDEATLEAALRGQPWDLALCDYALPGYSGVEALRLIREKHRLDTPVVFLSDAMDEEIAARLMKNGADDYVLKNNLARLPHIVARVLADVKAARQGRKQDALLNRERRLLNQLMTSIPDAIYFKDRYYRHTHVNELACRVLGATSPEQLLGQTADSLIQPDRAEKMRAEEERIFRTGEAIIDRIEEVPLPDGSTRWFSATKAPVRNDNGEIAGLVGITRDITDRMLVERKRAEAEFWNREILRVAPDPIIAMDHERRITVFNRSAEKVFGYTADEIIGQPVEILLPADAAAGHRSHVAAFENSADTEREMGQRAPLMGRRKNGELFPAEVSVSKTVLNGTMNFIAVVRDISERQAMMNENLRLEQSLRQAEKMQSLGTLAGGIAHEFNNLLTPIQLLAEMAQDEISPDDKLMGDLQTILANIRRAAELVERILAFSHTNKDVERRELHLRDVVNDAIGLLDKTLPSSITIHREFEDFDDRVMADETQLHQVLMNLASNAAHAMKDNVGDLYFTIKQRRRRRRRRGHGEAVLTVRDTGRGMDQSTAIRIFEPFFTTKPVGEGTGMGLAIIHGIVESHKGRIWVESEPGQGASFHIHLPLVTQPRAVKARMAKARSFVPNGADTTLN